MPDSQNSSMLFFLGRRVERLIFVGILLVILCFVETYLSTANRQFYEDRSGKTITTLLKRFELEEQHLSVVFQTKPESDASQISSRRTATKELTDVNKTRRSLGFPPHPPQLFETIPKLPTYKETLDNIVSELGENPFIQRTELRNYADPTKSPSELIVSLRDRLRTLENTPTLVWGIETPRILQVQYAGLDYKFPYGFVSNLLAVALAVLIIGWLRTLHITRQRELIMIAALEDFKLTFPHILNVLVVNILRADIEAQASQTTRTGERQLSWPVDDNYLGRFTT